MKKAEARKVLLRSRKGRFDPQDSELYQAVDLARNDPGLSEWLENQQAVNEAITGKFRDLEVPESLAARIVEEHRKTVPLPGRRRYSGLAIAAVIAILLTLVFTQMQPSPNRDFDSFRDRMARTVIREYRMDLNSNDLGEIRRFLTGNQGHPDFQVHQGLESAAPIGAGKLSWNGEPVSMVCFEKAADELLFLFVMDQAEVSGAPGSNPVFQPVSHLSTASWSSSGKIYVLASQTDEAELKRMIAP